MIDMNVKFVMNIVSFVREAGLWAWKMREPRRGEEVIEVNGDKHAWSGWTGGTIMNENNATDDTWMKMSGLNEMTSMKENEEDVNKDEREHKTMNRILHLLLKKTYIWKEKTNYYIRKRKNM